MFGFPLVLGSPGKRDGSAAALDSVSALTGSGCATVRCRHGAPGDVSRRSCFWRFFPGPSDDEAGSCS